MDAQRHATECRATPLGVGHGLEEIAADEIEDVETPGVGGVEHGARPHPRGGDHATLMIRSESGAARW